MANACNRLTWSLYAVVVVMTVMWSSSEAADKEGFPVSIIHINDLHARFEITDTSGGTCDKGEECIGGYPRTVYTVRRLLQEQAELNPIYINAGDSFQGTLWYNVGRWNVTQQMLNLLPADVMTLGNHEFDHGVEGLVPFLETVQTNMLVANMDCAHEPTLEGKYKKSMIIERSGRKIGVIGVILETTYDLANTGKVIFRNESDTIREEAQLLKAQGANIIIVVSHCGYDVDQQIAANAGDWIDVIVGSHSHTFLYTGVPPGPHSAAGDYPTEVIHSSGHRVLIVQASAYARYVGNLIVYFDDNGDVLDFEGDPLYMDQSVPEDEEVLEAMQPWKEEIDEMGKVVVGTSKVDLTKDDCAAGECNLGNFFCDAMVHSFVGMASYEEENWTNVSAGLMNIGGLRVPLYRGDLTYAHIVSMSPFENTLVSYNLPGNKIVEAMEWAVSKVDLENGVTGSHINLQLSGIRVKYDYTKPVGSRVISASIRCADCQVPKYEPLVSNKLYRLTSPNFLQAGGDGYTMLAEGTDLQMGVTDLDALISYSNHINPIYQGLDGRITVLN
ncbi:apyrase [Drosophila erecta]|uniref:apyrase n=1 Tax=Drosophila erecta TaxID=7220 RepID=UPI0001780F34|nr:apyrase [Drosophila erecta]